MKRREFVGLLGGVAAWPLAARAQQRAQMRRIGVLWGAFASDPEFERRLEALKQGLRDFGWADTQITFELRSAEGKLDRLPELATELVNANADIIVTTGTEPALAPIRLRLLFPLLWRLLVMPWASV